MLLADLKGLLDRKDEFPFLAALQESADETSKLAKQKYNHFFDSVRDFGNDLLDKKEDLLDPVRQFMGGSMADIYAEARRFLNDQRNNLDHVRSDATERIRTALNDAKCYAGNTMQTVKADLVELQTAVKKATDAERTAALERVQSLRHKLEGLPEYANLDESTQNAVQTAVQNVTQDINAASLIAVIRDHQRRFEDDVYPTLLDKVTTPPAPVTPGESDEQDSSDPPPPVPPKSVALRTLPVAYDRPFLANEADVEQYLDGLRSKILDEIAKGHRIRI